MGASEQPAGPTVGARTHHPGSSSAGTRASACPPRRFPALCHRPFSLGRASPAWPFFRWVDGVHRLLEDLGAPGRRRTAAAPARPPCLGRAGRISSRRTGKTRRGDGGARGRAPLRLLGLGCGRGLGLLAGPRGSMPHDTPARLPGNAPGARLPCDLAADTPPTPASWGGVGGPARFCEPQGQGGLLTPPRFQRLTPRAGPGHARPPADRLLTPYPQGPSAGGLAGRHQAKDAIEAEGATRLTGHRSRCASIGLAIPAPQTPRQATIATDAAAPPPLREICPPSLPRPGGWPRRYRSLPCWPRWLCAGCLPSVGALQGHRRRRLLKPGGRDRRDLQRLKRSGTTPLVQVGGTQPLQHLPQTSIVEGSPAHARLPEGAPTTGLASGSHVVQDVGAIQKRSQPGVYPAPTREPMGRVGGKQTVEERGDVHLVEHPQDQGEVRHRTYAADRNRHDASPCWSSPGSIIAETHVLR